MKARLLVCGSRVWDDERLIERMISAWANDLACVIEGEAPGADQLARRVAERLGVEVLGFPAEWTVHALGWCHCRTRGRICVSAGPRRNQQMLDEGMPTHVIGFSDDFWNPRSGTHHMCSIALNAGLGVTLVDHVRGLPMLSGLWWRSRILTAEDLVPASRRRRRT